jgi:cell division septum initiation protein DivIVA
MSNLYQLTNDFMEIVNQLEEMELDSEVLQDTLDSLQAPIEEKVENIVKYMKSLEALADAKKLEAKRLSDSASSDLKKVEWFKNYMADNLKKANITKLQAGIFSLGWRKGTEVVQVDVNKLPMEYHKQTYVPMTKTELKYLIKEEGKEIPGVSIVRNEDSLTIK